MGLGGSFGGVVVFYNGMLYTRFCEFEQVFSGDFGEIYGPSS